MAKITEKEIKNKTAFRMYGVSYNSVYLTKVRRALVDREVSIITKRTYNLECD